MASYCKEAGDIAPIAAGEYHDEIEYVTPFEPNYESDFKIEFASAIMPLMVLARERPDLSIVVERHIFMRQSYAQVAMELGITKQGVHKRLLMAVDMVPMIASIASDDMRMHNAGSLKRAAYALSRIRGKRRTRAYVHGIVGCAPCHDDLVNQPKD
jgi:hypothetical protein